MCRDDLPKAGLCVGCRHDNDYTRIADITIAPTQQEVPCRTAPYLPANHPGTVVHLEADSQEAHRDLHFRLRLQVFQQSLLLLSLLSVRLSVLSVWHNE